MKKILLLLAVLLTSSMSWADSSAYKNLAGEALITSASQLSSNASDGEEGQHIEYLIDGAANTFWHTDWHGVCTDQYHYLQVALNQEYTGDVILLMTRRNTGNDHPTKMIVWGSKDNAEYTEIGTISLPYDGMGTETGAKFTCNGYSYLRFAASDCSGESGNPGYRTFWHAAEFMLYKAKEVSTPKADLLDVQFNLDGTATDVSGQGTALVQIGTPKVVTSPKYGMNVYCGATEEWHKHLSNSWYFDFNDAMKAGIEDGYSMELFWRPNKGGSNVANATPFGWESGGGCAILLEDGTYRFETRAGGSYHTAVWDQTPPKDEWLHMVAVWNKEEGKMYFYVNGNQVASNDAAGDYSWPGCDLRGFIAADLDGGLTNELVASGDYAIVRLYNDPLTESQVSGLYAEIMSKDTGTAEHDDTPQMAELSYDENGYALISNGEQFYAYAKKINDGNQINAKLTADIDYTEHNYSIGDYYNELDGQNHTIKVDLTQKHEDAGLFEYTKPGSYIHNIHVDGIMRGNAKWTGLMIADDQGATIEDVLVTGDVYTDYSGSDSWTGLFAGYAKNNGCNYKNVVVYGTIHGENAGGCAGLIGEANTDQHLMENVFVAVDFQTSATARNPYYGGIRSGKQINPTNCTYVNLNGDEYGTIAEGISEISKDEAADGHLTAIMANNDTESPWRQTVGTDPYPTFDSTHGFVFSTASGYACVTPDNMANSLSAVCDEASTYASTAEANPDLIADLEKAIDALGNSQTMDEFYSNFTDYRLAREAVEANVSAYANFKQTVEDALTNLGAATGSAAEELRNYLTEDFEPNDDYPCGSASYIIENKSCQDGGLLAQTMWISEMLKKASASSAEAGTDVTVLLANADFSLQDSGWTGKLPKSYNESPAAAEYTGVSGKVSQTVEGLKEGIYELDMNAFAAANSDKTNTSFIASLFANDVEVPVMSVYEGKLPFENAEDGVNCYCTDADNAPYDMIVDDANYVPQSLLGGAIALNGGRYLNRILVNVTDGSLKVGARMDGSRTSHDWMMMANTHLIYQGTIAEAGDALTNVLSGMVDRAKTLIAFEASGAGTEYLYYPNCSAAVKAALQACVDEAASVSDNEAKYQLIVKMSPLFKQAYTERMAYKTLATKLEDYMSNYSSVDEETAKTIEKNYNAGWDGWIAGSYTAEEAKALGNTLLNSVMGNISEETPVADLLDVKFNADGSATDASAMANEIRQEGTPVITYSKILGQNLWCASSNAWGQDPHNYYKIPMDANDLWDHMCDGVSMEIYVRPYTHNTSWVGVLSYEQSGGIGMITDAQKWCIEAHVGGGYKEAYYAEPVDGEWIHLVGVWDKEAGKLMTYVNGGLAVTADAVGDMKAPSANNRFMIIGGDCTSSGNGEAAFQGDIAVARIYDKPLSEAEIARLYYNINNSKADAEEHDCDYPDYVDEEDGIQTVKTGQTINHATIQGIFNLMGQKLAKAQRGINIINGEKVLVK